MEIQNSESRRKYVQCWIKKKFSFPIAIGKRNSMCCIPHPVHLFCGRSLTLYMIRFFLYPRNFDIINCTKLTGLFIFLVLPLPPEKIYITALFTLQPKHQWFNYTHPWYVKISTLPKHDLWTLAFMENFRNIEQLVEFFSKVNISRKIIITVIIFSR